MRAYTAALLTSLLTRGTRWRVLDLGCGTGRMLSWLEEFPAVSVTGLDLSRDALRFCQTRGYRRLIEGSATTVPFQSESFDLVFCADVLQHIPSPGDTDMLREAARLLRPGGYLFLRTNSGCGEPDRTPTQSELYRRYKRADLSRRVAREGFGVERATYANALPALPMLIRRILLARLSAAHVQTQDHADPGLGRTIRPRGLRWIDAALAQVLQLEASVVGMLDADLPFGGSLLLVARKMAMESDA
ncbi:MAG TPA: class I SAM-dependent methyltransferase [Chloroflexota bacterium]